MSNGAFAISLVVGAALLALWVDVRFPVRDLTLGRIAVHAAAAFLLLHVLPAAPVGSVPAYAIVFALVLPALVYLWMSVAWFVRFAQGALGSSWS